MKIPARPWPEIVDFCRSLLPEYAPLLAIIEKLVASPYADGLVAYTSLYTVAIAQSEANFWHGPELRIEFDPSKQIFLFTYRQRLDDDEPWTRLVRPDEGFEVLERFLVKRARWFRKPVGAEENSPSPSSG